MPVTQFIETSESRSATLHRKGKRADSTVTVTYLAFGTSVDTEVHAYVNTFFSNNRFYTIGDYVFMVEQYSVEYVGDECFQVTATYTKTGADNEEQESPLRRTRSFDTGGGTQHITQTPAYDITVQPSLGIFDILPERDSSPSGERAYARPGESAPGQFGAIGVDGDSVAGVDIVVPALQWTETYDVPSIYVTPKYIKQTAFLSGTVNNAPFRTFRAGEVLFLGCSGNQEWDEEKGDGPWSLSYKFVASPNAGPGETLRPLKIGDIAGIVKKGHEYLWVKYQAGVSGSSLLKEPQYVYVNEVYPQANFLALGIGS
jgi:hypothetical protein